MNHETIALKDGTTTEDPRLDRLIEFDERSRDYPIRTILESKKPRSYTWRCGTFLNQKQEGACVGAALGHELSARPSEVLGLTMNDARDFYHGAQRRDPWPGGAYPGASPFYEGTSILAGVKEVQARGYFENYRWGFSLMDLILGVGRNGPAILGTNWYSSMFTPDSKGFLSISVEVAGGHALLVRAVNVKKEFFTLRNSWGRKWGQDGDCYLSFTDMRRLLGERGEAVFFMNRKTKPVIPTP